MPLFDVVLRYSAQRHTFRSKASFRRSLRRACCRLREQSNAVPLGTGFLERDSVPDEARTSRKIHARCGAEAVHGTG